MVRALTADNKPDPNGCGRVKLLDWIRKRRPDPLPVARLIMGTPSFIRLVKAEGALRLPSADGDDLDFSAADWDPLSLECPDYNDPNYAKSACLAWLQAQLPTEMGGCNIDTAFTRADSDFSMSLLKNWRTLVAHNPDFALDEGGASKYPAIAAAIATYESALSEVEGGVREAHRPRQKQVPHRPRRLPD